MVSGKASMSDQSIATLPLYNKRVLVTRTREQASVMSEKLRALGAVPVEFPTIRIVPPQDWGQLDAALRRLYAQIGSDYAWLVFTSVNGVNICCERVRTLGYKPGAMRNVRIAAIGPATAAALTKYGLQADLVPSEYIAEGVASALLADAEQKGASLAGQRILLARAAEARNVLVTELQQAGAVVDEVAAYYTLPIAGDDERGREIVALLRQGQLAILTFTSSSTVRNFVAWLKDCEQISTYSLDDLTRQPRPTIACIGPITSQTARELGLPVDIEASEFTIDGLIEAIVTYYAR
jgi:uroporphyrinogen-III synthase